MLLCGMFLLGKEGEDNIDLTSFSYFFLLFNKYTMNDIKYDR
jgi:hypothetical protein